MHGDHPGFASNRAELSLGISPHPGFAPSRPGQRAKCEEFLAESIQRNTRGKLEGTPYEVERDGGHHGKGTYTPDIILRYRPASEHVGNQKEGQGVVKIEVKEYD